VFEFKGTSTITQLSILLVIARKSSSILLLAMTMTIAIMLPASADEIQFTVEQAELGKEIYKETCQICHGTTLSNGQFGTPLRGSFFRNKWAGKTVGELFVFTTESMPPDNKGSLTPEQYAAALTYILSRNDLPAGTMALSADSHVLGNLMLPWEPK